MYQQNILPFIVMWERVLAFERLSGELASARRVDRFYLILPNFMRICGTTSCKLTVCTILPQSIYLEQNSLHKT